MVLNSLNRSQARGAPSRKARSGSKVVSDVSPEIGHLKLLHLWCYKVLSANKLGEPSCRLDWFRIVMVSISFFSSHIR